MLDHQHPVILARSRKLSADFLKINARMMNPDKCQRCNRTGNKLLSNEILHPSGVMAEGVKQREKASRGNVQGEQRLVGPLQR